MHASIIWCPRGEKGHKLSRECLIPGILPLWSLLSYDTVQMIVWSYEYDILNHRLCINCKSTCWNFRSDAVCQEEELAATKLLIQAGWKSLPELT